MSPAFTVFPLALDTTAILGAHVKPVTFFHVKPVPFLEHAMATKHCLDICGLFL